jgi:ComF family protein
MLNNRCAGCDEPGVDLCRRCRFALVTSPPVVTVSGVVAATEFTGLTKQLVLGLKYRNRRRLAEHLAEQLSRRLDPTQIDIVTWAPTSRRRTRRRGYDQAELLARALAARWRKPCRRMLFRRHGVAQTGRSRAERLHGPSFAARPVRHPPRILVVDDVVTTGATLHAARAALLAAGARSVMLAAVAATPDSVQARPARRISTPPRSKIAASMSKPTIIAVGRAVGRIRLPNRPLAAPIGFPVA